jgi:PAS domain S-box-containing protein
VLRTPRTPTTRYGVAILCILLATAARVALNPLVGDAFPFITYFGAVTAAAWLGGLGPGLLAVLLGAGAAFYFFMPPLDSTPDGGLAEAVGLVVFAIISPGIVGLCEMMRRERRRAGVLAAIVASSDDAIISKTLDGTITSWNAGAERLYGYSAAEVIGRNISLLIPEAVADDLTTILDCVRRGEYVEAYESTRRRKDGSEVAVSLKVSPIRDDEERVVGASIIARDVTARRRAEESLRASEERSRRVQRGAKIGTWDWNLLTNEVVWSDGIYDLLGLEPGTSGPSLEVFEQFIHPADRARMQSGIETALASGVAEFYEEFRAAGPEGQERWLASKAQIVRAEDGRPERLIGLNYDITERRRAEELLRRSEERFRLAASSEAITLFEHDRELRYLWVYPPHAEHTPNLEGRTDADLLASAEEASALMALKRRVVETGVGAREVVRVTLAAGVRWYEIVMEPRFDAHGEVTGVAGVALDVTARQRAEDALESLLERERAARAEAEAASRLKDEFLATVSHELRTPLTAIHGWAMLLRSGQLDSSSAEHAFEVIERNARAQKQIIADLLDVSRIIAGKMRLEVGRVELGGVVRAAVEAVRLAAESKGIELRMQVEPAAVYVNGDADRLQQVVWNLLTNAAKFTPEGGSITVRLERAETRAVISVEDTGQGIAPDFLPYVFDRFRQADMGTTRKHGGLGLGLAIVRHLVEGHGGQVSVESAGDGRGTTFVVSLPLVAQPAASTSERPAPAIVGTMVNGVGAMNAALVGARVLVVDDEPDTCEMVARLLGQAGAVVSKAGSVAEALAALGRQEFDLLITDIGMPDEDGYALVRQLRAAESAGGRRTPALALTAYARDEDRVRALAEGFQAHLAKPIDAAELLSVAVSLRGGVMPA